MNNSIYAFDLDGTVTTQEMLPLIARELHLGEELALLTRLTLDGSIGFEASFRLRFRMLRSFPVERIQAIVAMTPLDPAIEAFIEQYNSRCAIVTGNLDVWVQPLAQRLGCRFFTSGSEMRGGQLELTTVLDKGKAIRELASNGAKTVAVGESFNDIPMFEEADIGIAFGGVHQPVPQLVRIADYVVHSGKALCQLLQTL
jgi:HAD superfamily phosphoserine phosphatase-like hydrolase